MSLYRQKIRWKEGTLMRLSSVPRLKTFVFTKEDLEAHKHGRPVDFRKISQRRLADRAGLHPSAINHLVAGRRSECKPEDAERIAEVLGVDVTVLFDPEEPTANRRIA